MSDSRSRIYYDEEEWYDFKEENNIIDVEWDVYSVEASYAKEGSRKLGLKGFSLKLYVKHKIECDNLVKKQQKELAELKQFFLLQEKFMDVKYVK